MKKVTEFFKWLINIWNLFWNNKTEIVKIEVDYRRFQIKYVEDIPELIPDKLVFIVQDGIEPELLTFKCPCGCDAVIILNLLKDASPRWRYEINDEGAINVYPSIWRNVGCKSHFFVQDSNVKWV